MPSSQMSLKKSRKVFYLSTAVAHLHLPFASSQRSTSSQSPAGKLVITAIFVTQNSWSFFCSSYLQPMIKNCKHVIGSHAPIIDWAETAQLEKRGIMFTFDIAALYPSIQVWPEVERSLSFRRCRTSHSTFLFTGTRPGRVSCEIAAPCPVYTAHAVRRFLFRGHMGLVHWSSVCK